MRQKRTKKTNCKAKPQLLVTPGTLFVGIDGGSTGAIAALDPTGKWIVFMVAVARVRDHNLLSVEGNMAILRQLAASAGGMDQIVVAYEQSRINPMFGFVNNWVNARNEEFWRGTLSHHGIQGVSVDPKTWQADCLRGIKVANPKDRAREFIRRSCPEADWLDHQTKAKRLAYVDAMSIALWAKSCAVERVVDSWTI